MKLAISVPETTFAKADAMARRLGTSRSAVFAKAMDAYEDVAGDDLTEQINTIVDSMTQEEHRERDAWLRVGATTVLRHAEW